MKTYLHRFTVPQLHVNGIVEIISNPFGFAIYAFVFAQCEGTLRFHKLLPPANEVCKGYVFTPDWHSVRRRGSASGGLGRPPWMQTPPIGRYGIRSTSGRYASYWNAFLFLLTLEHFSLLWMDIHSIISRVIIGPVHTKATAKSEIFFHIFNVQWKSVNEIAFAQCERILTL